MTILDDAPRVRRALALIFAILLLDVVGFSMLFPIAPFIVLRYSSDASMVTLLTVLYAAAQFVSAPLLGKLGDMYGRRPVLLASLVVSVLGYCVFGLAGALWAILLSRVISGLAAGNQSVASAVIADVSAPEKRAQNFTLIGLAWGIGLVIGPAAGAALGQWRLDAPMFLAAGLSLVALLLVIFVLPETLPDEHRASAELRLADLNPLGSIAAYAGRPSIGPMLAVLALFHLGFQGINSTESLYLIERFAAEPWQLGALMVVSGVTIAAVQRFVGPLTARFGERRVAQASLALLGAGAVATLAVPLLWLVFPLASVRTIASGLIFPTLGSLLAGRVSAREQGELMGVTTALGSLMGVAGPLWAGAAYERVMPGSPYLIGAAVLGVAAALLARPSRSSELAQTAGG